MVLEEIKIENFRSFHKLKIKPTGINIVVGRNNSGKTSFLEALSFIFNHDDEIRLFASNPILLINAQDFGKESTISILFNKRKISLSLREVTPEEISSELQARFKNYLVDYVKWFESMNKRYKVHIRSFTNIIDNGKLEFIMNEFARTDYFNALVNQLLKTSMVVNDSNISKLEVPENKYLSDFHVWETLSDIIYTGTNSIGKKEDKKMQEEFLRSISLFLSFYKRGVFRGNSNSITTRETQSSMGVEPSYFRKISQNENFILKPIEDKANLETESLRIEQFVRENRLLNNLQRFGFGSIVFGKDDNTYEIPMKLMGDGFISLINIIREISRKPKPEVIAIEEPERDLHPGYIEEFTKYIVRLAKETGSQFFITTHSEDFLKSLFQTEEESKEIKDFISRELSIIRLSKVSGKSICRVRNFYEAKEELVDLELDLRGI